MKLQQLRKLIKEELETALAEAPIEETTHKLEKDELGKFYVVTKPSQPKENNIHETNIMEFAKNETDRKALEFLFTPQVTAWPLVAPPNVPEARIKILRTAFMKTVQDPAFLAEAHKLSIEVDPVTGEKMQELVARISGFERSVIDRALELTVVK
jgi:hypothetical protein